MRNTLTVLFMSVAVAGTAQLSQPASQSSDESRGLLSRLRNNGPSTRQQIQNPAVEVAQPAAAPQGYRPGVTFPQQQAQQQAPAQAYPGYPPYNMQAQPYYPPQQAPGAATPTPTPAQRSSSNNNDDNDSRESRPSSSSSRSGSRSSGSSSSRSSSSGSDASKSSSSSSRSSDSDSEKKSGSTGSRSSSEEKATSGKPEASESGSKSSTLEKIAKKVESGKPDEKADAEEKPKKTKEEIEIEKAREAALKAADEATTVVANFLQQANDGYYSKASDQLAPTIQKYFQSEMSAVNGTQKAVMDELTANGTITMVTYVNRIVRGEGAEVEAELVYEDGRTIRRTFDLIEIDGDWKIVLPVTPGATAASTTNVPAAAPTPTPAPQAAVAPPPSAEQAAANAPMVLAPGLMSQDSATSAPQ